jgi:hypothetical protein
MFLLKDCDPKQGTLDASLAREKSQISNLKLQVLRIGSKRIKIGSEENRFRKKSDHTQDQTL